MSQHTQSEQVDLSTNDTAMRRSSYATALAVIEQLLAASPAVPTTINITCYRWSPTEPRITLVFHDWADGVRQFAAAMGVAVTARPHTDEPGSDIHTSATGHLDGIPYEAYALTAPETVVAA